MEFRFHGLPIRVLFESRRVAVEIPKSPLVNGCQQNVILLLKIKEVNNHIFQVFLVSPGYYEIFSRLFLLRHHEKAKLASDF